MREWFAWIASSPVRTSIVVLGLWRPQPRLLAGIWLLLFSRSASHRSLGGSDRRPRPHVVERLLLRRFAEVRQPQRVADGSNNRVMRDSSARNRAGLHGSAGQDRQNVVPLLAVVLVGRQDQ